MKKTLTIILTICIALSLSAGFGGVAIEDPDIEVSVGMQFAWNKGTDPDEQWLSNGGWSADGLWCYKIHPVIRPQLYLEAIITADGEYAWSATPETAAILADARIRAKGEGVQPGIETDAVKVFHCPAAGTVRLETTIRRVTEYITKEDSLETPTTLAVYVEDRRVCPEADAEFIVISSTEEKTFSCTFQVHKNERVYIHVGAMGNAENDEVIMSNTITYEELYKGCPPPPTTGSTATDQTTTDTENGSSAGLILGIVAAVVVVVGAVAFIFIKKKKAE